MAFPDEPRDIELSVLIDGTWVDAVTVGNGVRSTKSPIRVSAGRSNWGGQADAASLDWVMDNRDGRWSPRNASGAYAGLLRRNLPARYGINHGTTYLGRGTSSAKQATMASTPDAAALDITGDIDVRIEVELDEDLVEVVTDGGYRARLACKGDGISSGWSWELFRNTSQGVDITFNWYDGAWNFYNLSDIGGTLSEEFQQTRFALRFTLDVSTGEGIFHYANTIAGPWVAVTPITSAGATSITANSEVLAVGGWSGDLGDVEVFPGRVYAFELYDGIAGTLVADPTFEGQTAGAASFADSSRTWTLGSGGRITNVRWRFWGELASIPTRWTVDGADVWAPVQAAGLLRRLRRRPDVRSVPRRFIERNTENTLVQYWPCEDAGTKALDQFGAVVGTAPISVTGGEPQPAAFDGFLGSLPVPTLDADVWSATVDTHTDISLGFTVRWHMWTPADWTGTNVTVLDVRNATHRFLVQMSDGSGGTLRVQIQNSSGTPVYTPTAAGFSTMGTARRYHLSVFNDSGDYGVRLLATTENAASTGGTVDTSTGVTASPGKVVTISVNPNGNANGYSLGHVTHWRSDIGTSGMVEEISSFSGETAAARIRRLCVEEGIRSRIYGDPTASQTMGPQFPGTIGSLLQECADTDLGILHESATSTAIAYRVRDSMIDQTAITFDHAIGELSGPLEPEEDDAEVVNDWEVKNAQGGIARARLDDASALSVSEPPVGVGRYPRAVTVSALSANLQTIADRLLALGTVDEPRISRLPIGLHLPSISSSTARVTEILEARIGDLITVENNLAAWDNGPFSQIMQGWEQTTENYQDSISYLTSSSTPYVADEVVVDPTPLAVVGAPEWEYNTTAMAVTNPDPTANSNTVLAIAVGHGTTNSPTITVVPPPGVTATELTGLAVTTADIRVRAWTYPNDGASTKTFGYTSGSDNRSACILIPLDGAATAVVEGGTPVTGNGPTVAFPTVTTVVDDLVIAFAGRRANSETPGAISGFTVIDDDTAAAVNPQGVAWYDYATGTSTTPASVTWSGSANTHAQAVVAFRGAGAGGGGGGGVFPTAARISSGSLTVDMDAGDVSTWGKTAEGQKIIGGGRFNQNNDDNIGSLVWEADGATINSFTMQDGTTARLKPDTVGGIDVVNGAIQYVVDGSYEIPSAGNSFQGVVDTPPSDPLFFDGSRISWSHIALGHSVGPAASPIIMGCSFVVQPWMYANSNVAGPLDLHAPTSGQTGPIANYIANGNIYFAGKYSLTPWDPDSTSNLPTDWTSSPVALPAVGEWFTQVAEFIVDPGGTGYLDWYTLNHSTGEMVLSYSRGSNFGWIFDEADPGYVAQNDEFYLILPAFYAYHQYEPTGATENWDAAGAATGDGVTGTAYPNVRRSVWAWAASSQSVTASQMIGHAKFFLGIS